MKSFDAPMNRKRVRDEDLALLRAKVPKLCRTSWTFGSRCAQPTRTAMVKWVHFFVCVRPKMWVTIHQVDIINDNLDHIILRWPAIKRQATLGGFFRIFLPALASILSISFIPQCGRICLGLGRPNFLCVSSAHDPLRLLVTRFFATRRIFFIFLGFSDRRRRVVSYVGRLRQRKRNLAEQVHGSHFCSSRHFR